VLCGDRILDESEEAMMYQSPYQCL